MNQMCVTFQVYFSRQTLTKIKLKNKQRLYGSVSLTRLYSHKFRAVVGSYHTSRQHSTWEIRRWLEEHIKKRFITHANASKIMTIIHKIWMLNVSSINISVERAYFRWFSTIFTIVQWLVSTCPSKIDILSHQHCNVNYYSTLFSSVAYLF